MHTQYNNNNTVMNHGYRQSLCQLTVKELKQTDALLIRQIILSMRTCFFLSRTHTHHKDTHTRACWRLQMGRETDLPSTGRKRMEEEGKERKEKEKPGVILVRKKKRQKVKSVFLGWGVAQRDGVNAHRHSKPKGLLLGQLLVGQGFTEDSRGLNLHPGSYLVGPGVLIPRGQL